MQLIRNKSLLMQCNMLRSAACNWDSSEHKLKRDVVLRWRELMSCPCRCAHNTTHFSAPHLAPLKPLVPWQPANCKLFALSVLLQIEIYVCETCTTSANCVSVSVSISLPLPLCHPSAHPPHLPASVAWWPSGKMGNGNWQWVNSFQLWLKNFANLSPFGTATLAQRGVVEGRMREVKGARGAMISPMFLAKG